MKIVFGLMLTFAAVSIFRGSAEAAHGPYYVSPSWDQTLPANERFLVLSNMNNDAVLDRETGLVWERSPSTSKFIWILAHYRCNALGKGNRQGWRVPTLQELGSLVDLSVAPAAPTLPIGHPFQDVEPSFYWSATSYASDPSIAWGVDFNFGVPSVTSKTPTLPVWCVRGGQGVDPQ